MSELIYFDNAATTKICNEALHLIEEYSRNLYFNASSAYTPAVKIETEINETAKNILKVLGCQKGKIFFTSGGTESDNMAILGAAKKTRKMHIISSRVEHPAVLNTLKELESKGYGVTYLPVDERGFLSADDLAKSINDDTFLVSIMHVNNETGAIQDIKNLSRAAKARDEKVLFHSDGIQAYSNIPVDLDDLGVDMYSLSSHKIHGPKGVGALYVKNPKKIAPITYGGGQQEGYRSGTLNSPGILSFAKAFELAEYNEIKDHKFSQMKSYLADKIQNEIDDVICINIDEGYSNHILSMAFKGINAETLLHACQYDGLIISTGSACSSKKNIVSNTLKQMEMHEDYIGGAVRISFSRYNDIEEARAAFQIIKQNVEKLRKYSKT